MTPKPDFKDVLVPSLLALLAIHTIAQFSGSMIGVIFAPHSGLNPVTYLAANTIGLGIVYAMRSKYGISVETTLKLWNADLHTALGKACKYLGLYFVFMVLLFAMAVLGCRLAVSMGLVDLATLENIAAMYDADPLNGTAHFNFSFFDLATLNIITFLLAPVFEEVIYRRFLYAWFRKRMSVLPSVIFGALIFGLGHGIYFVQATIAGVFLCYFYEKERNLLINILVHIGINICVTFLEAFPIFD